MPLPQLNQTIPKYELVIPSTQETVKFRPFLVGEQKLLLIAFESKNNKDILNSMLECLRACVPGVNIEKLAAFDVDYMFTQVRAKSVGETTKVMHPCEHCNEENDITIKLDDIKMDMSNISQNNEVKVTDDITIELQYPTYANIVKSDVLNIKEGETPDQGDILMATIQNVIKSVKTPDEHLILKDEPKEEVDKFINSLTNQQLQKITDFASNAPTLIHEEVYECKKCKKENLIVLKGLNDFF